MTPEHLIQCYQQGKRDFLWADLRGVSLRGYSLAGTNFNRAKLQGADLSGADLSGCSFLKADLSNANLAETNLTGACFRKANLMGAILAVDQLPDSALQGATLPDGNVAPILVVSPPQVEAREPVLDVEGIPSMADDTVSQLQAAPERWAKSIDVQAEIAKRPPPPPLPRPRTRTEVIAAVPWIPMGLFIGGYTIDGLVLYLSAAGGAAWIVSAIATQLWALHSGLTWFIPVVVALAALLGGPMSAVPLLVLPATTFVMMLGGFLVVGWHWRTALHGAIWLAGVTAVLFCMTPWLIAPTGAFTAVIAPTALLAGFLIVAIACISIGLTGIEAMSMARIYPRHQQWVTGLGGAAGLVTGALFGWLASLLA